MSQRCSVVSEVYKAVILRCLSSAGCNLSATSSEAASQCPTHSSALKIPLPHSVLPPLGTAMGWTLHLRESLYRLIMCGGAVEAGVEYLRRVRIYMCLRPRHVKAPPELGAFKETFIRFSCRAPCFSPAVVQMKAENSQPQ